MTEYDTREWIREFAWFPIRTSKEFTIWLRRYEKRFVHWAKDHRGNRYELYEFRELDGKFLGTWFDESPWDPEP